MRQTFVPPKCNFNRRVRRKSGDQLQCDKLSSHRSAISTEGSDTKVVTSSNATNFRLGDVAMEEGPAEYLTIRPHVTRTLSHPHKL